MKRFKKVDLSKYSEDGQRLPEHITLMLFDNDSGNYAFNEWWFDNGAEIFNEWCLSKKEYECEANN